MFWIGLQIEGDSIKWAKVSKEGKNLFIKQLKTDLLAEEEHVNPLYFSQKQEQAPSLISGLETAEVLLRECEIQLQNKRKIAKLLPFQLEPQIPYSQEEAVVAVQILKEKNGSSRKALFLATKTSTLLSHKELLQKFQLDPDQVSCVPAALRRFTSFVFPDLDNALIIHMGLKATTLIYLKEKNLAFSHSFPIGFETFSSAEKTASLQFQRELDRAISSLLQKNNPLIENIVLTGHFHLVPGLKQSIAQSLPEGIEVKACPEEYESYAVPIGLALEGLIADEKSCLFCEGALSSLVAKNKRKNALFSFAGAALAATCLSLLFSQVYASHKKKELLTQFQTIAPVASLEELETVLEKKELELTKRIGPYPLSPALPIVLEVLASLSSYPGLVDIKKVHYELAQYPKTGSVRTPYRGKVLLELEIQDLQEARVFQQYLKHSSSLVDSKKEFTCDANGVNYRISFFLQPKVEL